MQRVELLIDVTNPASERAAARGLLVGFEALSWGRHIRRWGHAWRIVQAVDHPALGLIVDSFHTLALRDDPAGLADVPGDVPRLAKPFRQVDLAARVDTLLHQPPKSAKGLRVVR